MLTRFAIILTLLAPITAQAQTPSPTHFYVFFDHGSASISPKGQTIIAEAVDSARATHSARVEIVGCTDTSEPADTEGLSYQRAAAVAQAMVQHGAPAGIVFSAGFGWTYPLVKTGPNYREPQNRRAEIFIK